MGKVLLFLGGVALGAAGMYAWLGWYLRDVFR